eukprot:scaffold18.g2004.t1
MDLVEKHPTLQDQYRVIYGDIYTLHPAMLPALDLAALFHVGEYASSPLDVRLIKRVTGALKPGGHMLFHRKSNAWERAVQRVADARRRGPQPAALLPVASLASGLEVYRTPRYSCKHDVLPAAVSDPKYWQFFKWFLPGEELKLGRGEMTSRSRLMIVAHPDDELIFGGSSLLGDTSDWFVVFCTKGGSRQEGAKMLALDWDFSGVMFHHADSPIKHLQAMDYRLFAELGSILGAQRWRTVITHNIDGDYRHSFHIVIHNVIIALVAALPPELRPHELLTFDSRKDWVDEAAVAKAEHALEHYYKRRATNWPALKKSGSKLQPLHDVDLTRYVCA